MLRRFLGDRGGGRGASGASGAGGSPAPPVLEIGAYAADCVLQGSLTLSEGRLLEMLNELGAISLHNVTIEALSDGHRLSLPSLDISRDELVAMAIAGPRGSETRRRATKAAPTALRLGPYGVWGLLHSVLSGDPMSTLHGHRVMVPLTLVTIVYSVAGVRRLQELPGLIINRDDVEHVNEPITEHDTFEIELDRVYGIVGRLAMLPQEAAEGTSGHRSIAHGVDDLRSRSLPPPRAGE